jgi:hypothetical protein
VRAGSSPSSLTFFFFFFAEEKGKRRQHVFIKKIYISIYIFNKNYFCFLPRQLRWRRSKIKK